MPIFTQFSMSRLMRAPNPSGEVINRKSIGTYDAWVDGMLCHVVIQGFKIAHIIDYVQILCLPMPDAGVTG